MNGSTAQGKWEEWNGCGGPKYPHEKVVQFTFRNFPADARRGARALDLGCGSGVHAKFLAVEGFEVHGTDISTVGIQNTLTLMKGSGLSGEFQVATVERIPYPDDFFDFVISIAVLDCVGPVVARAAIGEVIRVLKRGGKALLCCASDRDFRVLGPNPLGLHGFNDAQIEAMLPHSGLAIRWIDRYITTQKNQTDQQNDYLLTLQKE